MISELTTIESLFLSFRDGTKKPYDVVRKYLEKIETHNAYYSAYQSVWEEEALAGAELATKALAAGHDLGPLHGVPFALKDIFHVTDKVTTCGAVELNQNVAKVTATVVRRLVNAGAIILGKTKTVECAFGGWGTNHGWHKAHSRAFSKSGILHLHREWFGEFRLPQHAHHQTKTGEDRLQLRLGR